MTSFTPRPPYTEEELNVLFPKQLQLQQVQVLLRHGERAPIKQRFQNTGLSMYWPYCHAAKRLLSVMLTSEDPSKIPDQWQSLLFQRQVETFGPDDSPTVASGPNGEKDGICIPGEITDRGRETTLALGQRLRKLYVDRLNFMPSTISSPDDFYLRATPMPRALESVQQVFTGLYPLSARTATMPPPVFFTRMVPDETLFDNTHNCKRFGQLSQAFTKRTAERWNDSEEMEYLNKKIAKWMPEESPRIAVDGRPRISGIMDTLNATLAHGPATRLPKEFEDAKLRDIIDRIAVEEWYGGYSESHEFRKVGMGALIGDVVTRMVKRVEENNGGPRAYRFGMSGAHDTTLAGILACLGAFDGKWPPYTSHIAIELFKKAESTDASTVLSPSLAGNDNAQTSWFQSLFGGQKAPSGPSKSIARKHTPDLTPAEKERLRDYYVRVRYNDRPVTVPGCRAPGKHLDGDESFCTLEAFKAIADFITPRDWKKECNERLDKSPFPEKVEPAGYADE